MSHPVPIVLKDRELCRVRVLNILNLLPWKFTIQQREVLANLHLLCHKPSERIRDCFPCAKVCVDRLMRDRGSVRLCA